ncbi:hypothetical protein CYMTET_23835 [Cymbomonas tetramitiformis]|uniref:Uncharacterized protein n=1 Tax=Cymbomonas tetramitiformis TaxID=36881 RepID=A0AAE0FYH9_9CHLO|nr:hypothetical protein CYMTET_23835 [Cymbomonas tetramitiformis]
MVDPYVRAAVAFALGEAHVRKIERTFNESNVYAALKTYNGGVADSKYARLISEYSKYKGEQGDYKESLEAVRLVVKLQLSEIVLPKLTDEEKSSKLLKLIRVLKELRNIGTGVTFWSSLDVTSADRSALVECNIAALTAVIHARVPEVRPSFDEWCTEVLNEEEADAMLYALVVEASDEEDEEGLPAGEESVGEDSEEGEDCEEEDLLEEREFVIPKGYCAVPKPAALLRGTSDIDDLWVFMLWNVGWCPGKVVRYTETRRNHNYDILWDEGTRGTMLTLDSYFVQLEAEPKLGDWVYLRKN